MIKERLSFLKYKFDKGPVPLTALLCNITEDNCRLAIQDFLFVLYQKYFSESELLNPDGYLKTGSFLKKEYSDDFFNNLQTRSIIYAEGIKNKKGQLVNKMLSNFPSYDDYLISLHTAIFIENLSEEIAKKLPGELQAIVTNKPAIWHATAIEGTTCVWSIEKFCEYYKPVTAKRFV